jgi:hypothetical protein
MKTVVMLTSIHPPPSTADGKRISKALLTTNAHARTPMLTTSSSLLVVFYSRKVKLHKRCEGYNDVQFCAWWPANCRKRSLNGAWNIHEVGSSQTLVLSLSRKASRRPTAQDQTPNRRYGWHLSTNLHAIFNTTMQNQLVLNTQV